MATAILLCALIAVVASDPVLKPWSNAFTMTQWQYSGFNKNESSEGIFYDKQISYMYYDYNKRSYRNDYHTVRGVPRINSSSIWIKNILYIIDFTNDPFGCQVLDLGFGMMTPDWFVDGEFLEYIYLLEGRDDVIKRTFHFSKESSDGPFHYFASDPDQIPFRLSAPEALQKSHVVNNWYDYHVVDAIDDTYFELASKACTNSTMEHVMDRKENQKKAIEALGFMYHLGMYSKQE